MTITAIQKPLFHSDLTGCNYDTYEDACKAEFRELLAQRLQAESALHCTVCLDLATWFADAYPELWKPKAPVSTEVDRALLVAQLYQQVPGVSSKHIAAMLDGLVAHYNVSITAKE